MNKSYRILTQNNNIYLDISMMLQLIKQVTLHLQEKYHSEGEYERIFI